MICVPCRRGDHDQCDDRERAADPAGLHGGEWCYCKHETGTVLRHDRKPDPRRGA